MNKEIKYGVFITVFMSSFSGMAQRSSHEVIKPLTWEVGHTAGINEVPATWYPAVVPGSVQLDLARALGYGPYFYAENWKDYLWMEDRFFIYRSVFPKPEVIGNEKCYFISLGIDYEFEIWFNGEKLLHQEGMFTPVRLDLTNKLRGKNELSIKIYPVPKLHPFPADRSQAAQSVKPAVSYGWDWHPRLVPSGIWDETGLLVEPETGIRDFEITYTLDNDYDVAHISGRITGNILTSGRYSWIITDPEGKEVLRKEGAFQSDEIALESDLSRIQLWWPYDQGKSNLYNSNLQVWDPKNRLAGQKTQKIGFRTIRLVMNEGAWNEPRILPKTRSVPPIQFEINGRRIFCKGTNWVNPEIFPGMITAERYNELLDRAREANFNILRVWGGGIVNKDAFYELCDEMGILVWQEFPLACNNYEGTPHYLEILEQESASIIKRLRIHPSLAIWCGGNELFNSWSGMTDQSPAIRLLNSQCYRLDPATPFLPTSPVMGIGHGHYIFKDNGTGEEVFQLMLRAKNTAYTEFGMPAPSSLEVLKTIIPENELWPPKPGTSWESHHAFKAWVGNTWLMPDLLAEYFGEARNLGEMIANGQLLQCEGYKCIYEEARRQKPYCSMALNWCFNEPWPTAANNSLINWPNIPKPAFYEVGKACRPFLASARLRKFTYREGEEFSAELWILNDLPYPAGKGKITVSLAAGNKKIRISEWNFPQPEINTNICGPLVKFRLPAWDTDRFKLLLEMDGHPEFNSEYTLLYKPLTSFSSDFTIAPKQSPTANPEVISFPADFLIGVSSSAYQIEGAWNEDGKGESNWDRFSNTPGNVKINGNIAADHYHRYQEDAELLKKLGVKSYRFSIAWTRIYPDGTGQINQKGLDFYKNLVRLLKANGIVPIVTLFHWDLPQKLEDQGGWANRATVDAFENFAITMFRELGSDVTWWTTFNEPWVTCFMGYWLGKFAPGIKDLPTALQCTHNILLAHGKAVKAIRGINPAAKIGITLDLQMALPADPDNPDDVRVTQCLNDSHHAWFADPIFFGRYPADVVELYSREQIKLPEILPGDMEIINQPVDYLGLNFYHTETFKMVKNGGWWPYFVERIDNENDLILEKEVDATGLYTLLKYLDNRYNHTRILITENGTTTNDFINNRGEINDEYRIEYIFKHLQMCRKAMEEGVNLIGYSNWSFLDDYEWGEFGRMGMIYVDFKTQERILKKSGYWYARCIRENAFHLD